MIKKFVIGVCGLFLAALLSFPAFADQSIGYQHYYNEGVQALKEHDDQRALRCFKIAKIYDPASKDVDRYLKILGQEQQVIPSTESLEPQLSKEIIFYGKEKQALAALENRISEAVSNAEPQNILVPPESSVPSPQTQSIPVIVPSQPYSPQVQAEPAAIVPQPAAAVPQPTAAVVQPTVSVPEAAPIMPPPVASQPAVMVVQPAAPQPAAVVPQPAAPQPAAVVAHAAVPQPAAVYVPMTKSKQPPAIILLSQLINNGQMKPKLQIEFHSSVILEGKNIQRFLVVQEGFINVKINDPDHLEIDALAIGSTFLHVWDDSGRHSLFIEVIFAKELTFASTTQMNGVQHSQPFIFTYTNDWNTYYNGKNIPALKRQSYELDQSLSVTGETPYGFFDSSGAYINDGSVSEVNTYTVGLSKIPVEGTSDFDLRAFDALRYLSPLTMPNTRLRGAFGDVDLLDDDLGLSFSHGEEQEPLGFLLTGGGGNQFLKSYIDAAQLTLFPKSNNDQYSFNYATSYGPERETYLTDHVYSAEGQHKFNDFLTLNAEQGSDSSHGASLASLNWSDGGFKSALNFRNIDKDYTDIVGAPSNQGETGAAWTTDTELKNITASSFFEAYQDHLYPNPEDPRALNYDGNGRVKTNITDSVWSDSNFSYEDTAGEASPSRSLGFNQRISKSFGVWNSMKGIVFFGGGYENSHASGADISDYDLEDAVAGIQLPLTHQLSVNASYQYDWLDQPDGGKSNPGVLDTGLEYQKQINPRLTFTSQVSFHDEIGVKSSNGGVLSGEETVIISSGFNYNPTPDVNFFGDCNASKLMSHLGSPSSDDFEAHLGVRLTLGGAFYWDPLGTVTGIVFKDRNGDGKFGPGDEGVAGVKVKVGDKQAITDKYGRYRIKIRAKGVDVSPVLDSVPGGLLFSTPESLNVRIFQGRVIHADFGLIVQTGIYGIVFMDQKGSFTPNEGDKFIGKVKLILDGKTIQKSDSHGAFYFRNVKPGVHTITIDINSLSLNMVPLLKLKNTINVAEGTNYMFNIPVKIAQAEGDQS